MAKSIILKALLDKLEVNVSQFEKKIDTGASTISKAISRNSEIKLDIVEKIVKAYPQINRDWLLTGEGNMLQEEDEDKPHRLTGADIRNKKAFTPTEDNGLIYVPIAAQAGYARNFMDPVYIEQLDRLFIPGLPYKGDNHRYFDVEGDSMEPTLEEGMQVVGEAVAQEHWKDVRNYYIYVVVTESRICIKRLYKKDDKHLVLISDNEALYPQELMNVIDIKELWLVKRKLDWRMTPPKQFEIKI